MLSLAQENGDSDGMGHTESDIGMLEAFVVIILFIAMSHFLSQVYHKRSSQTDQSTNFHEKTDKELAQFSKQDLSYNDESEKVDRSRDSRGRHGSDYMRV